MPGAWGDAQARRSRCTLTEAFRVLGGVPQRVIFDNMRTAVDKIGLGKARQVNAG